MHAMPSIDQLAGEIKTQADRLFPARTDASMFLKMYGELSELIDAGEDCAEEVADVLIMVLDYAARKGINIHDAVVDKMATNNRRTWVVSALGVMQHA